MSRWPRYLAWAIVGCSARGRDGDARGSAGGGSDEPLLIALSTQRIEIDSNFAGTSILLFGATDVVGDVVVSVRGPEEPVVVRRKRQSAGVWIKPGGDRLPQRARLLLRRRVPAAGGIAPAEFLDRRQLGSQRLLLEAIWFDTSGDANEFRAALHRDRERDSLYKSEPGTVEFIDERLFRTTIDLPAHVPTGDYVVEAMLMVGGGVLSTRSEALSIEKAGFSADISTFARRTKRFTASLLSRSRWWQDGWAASPSARAEDAAGDRCHERATDARGGRSPRRRQVTFLVCVADDGHSEVAARFAALRARNSGGHVVLLHVMQPPEFQHWAAVGELMRQETREEAELLLQGMAAKVTEVTGAAPSTAVREGGIGDEILGHIAENDAINLLVVGAAPPDQGRGSLISWLAGQLAGQLNIPLVVVPGSLSDQQLQDLT